MKKKLFVFLSLLFVILGLVACAQTETKPVVQEDATFTLEVRAYNGVDANYTAKIDGTLLASKVITVKAGQVTVSEALAEIAPAVDGVHKITFNDTDYLVFTETTLNYSTSWYLNDGHFNAEPNYIDGDFQWSYMAYNNHYSNGVTMDFVEGLNTYTIVIDGYDGTTGSNPSF